MVSRLVVLIAVAALIGSVRVHAQEPSPGPGVVEVTLIPAGGAFVMSKQSSPSFGNYVFGTAVGFNFNRLVGVEGEVGAMITTTSNLQVGQLNKNTKAPNMLAYMINGVVSPWNWRSVVPYGTAGIGGLTMFERAGVGVTDDKNFLLGNVGGGLKWYARNSRWGLRGDYKFFATRSSSDAPGFFGKDGRYAHRVYAGVVVNAGR